MTARSYQISVDSEGDSVITIVGRRGAVTTVTQEHPAFGRVVQALIAGEDPWPLIVPGAEAVGIDPRIKPAPRGGMAWEGRQLSEAEAEAVRRYRREGRSFAPLVRFFERLDRNPSAESRESLLAWLEVQALAVLPDGRFVAYKGVQADRRSVTAAPERDGVTVNGTPVAGHVPNENGAVVAMPRAAVNSNRGAACATGLHVGSYAYARGFGRVLLRVAVDPAHVVSVPRDSGCQKLRCHQYEVLGVHGLAGDELRDLETAEGPGEAGAVEDALQEAVPRRFLARLVRRLRGRTDDGAEAR